MTGGALLVFVLVVVGISGRFLAANRLFKPSPGAEEEGGPGLLGRRSGSQLKAKLGARRFMGIGLVVLAGCAELVGMALDRSPAYLLIGSVVVALRNVSLVETACRRRCRQGADLTNGNVRGKRG